MKILSLLTSILLLCIGQIFAHEGDHGRQLFDEISITCESSLLGVINNKAYLDPSRVFFLANHFYVLNDHQKWIPCGTLFQDTMGINLYAYDPRCPAGHVGFKKVKGLWYCLEDGCSYFYGKYW
jgi:hypothetical protein